MRSECNLEREGYFHLKGKEIVTVPCPSAGGERLKHFCRFLHKVTDPEETVVMHLLCTNKRISLGEEGFATDQPADQVDAMCRPVVEEQLVQFVDVGVLLR